MLLTVDLGNTSVKFSIFDDDKQLAFLYQDTAYTNFKGVLLQFIYKASLRENQIDKAILSCVVPKVYDTIYEELESIVGKGNVIDITPNDDYGIVLNIPNPMEVGDDLLVMASYAYNLYHREMIVVSIGTCTVLSHITADGEFKHCIIAPGFSKIAETLWKNAAQLPEFDLEHKGTFLANTTLDAMNVGIYEGYIGMLRHLIQGMANEIGKDVHVIACGGLGKKVVDYIPEIEEYDPDFVTKGLQYIYKRFYLNA